MSRRNESESDLARFLRDAVAQVGGSEQELLARVFHLDDPEVLSFSSRMETVAKGLFEALDYELRIRNPGLHYVNRDNYLGYRREHVSTSGAGERSQIFASVPKATRKLDVIIPLDPKTVSVATRIVDVTGVGHHGVGNLRVSIESTEQLQQFLVDFDFWLRPDGVHLH